MVRLQRLPRRVLVSKRTPFRREEIEGILAGLDGVPSVDLVSVESEAAWRYVAQGTSASEPARYPVRRGTVVGLDHRSFLLWVHALDPKGRPYF